WLDSVTDDLDLAKNILTKIDVQGFEDRVIVGGLKTIRLAKLLIIELSFENLYDGQSLFDTIYQTMKQLGFEYHGNFSQILNAIDGNILTGFSLNPKAAGKLDFFCTVPQLQRATRKRRHFVRFVGARRFVPSDPVFHLDHSAGADQLLRSR